eukprot:snap_masked-scaffold_88-processed-gene-0.24-mRNA-1 protein AED:1.00 eAED:1.00 QI:0/-1/0/0/-1/1/1/0/120
MKYYKLRFNASKSQILAKTTEWCGRMFTEDGYYMEDKHFNKILLIPAPRNLYQLETISYLVTWLAFVISFGAQVRSIFQSVADKLRKKHNILDKKRWESDNMVLVHNLWTKKHEKNVQES